MSQWFDAQQILSETFLGAQLNKRLQDDRAILNPLPNVSQTNVTELSTNFGSTLDLSRPALSRKQFLLRSRLMDVAVTYSHA